VSDLEHELEATLRARQEVGSGLEPQLVERFVDKLESEIDRRVDMRLAQRRYRGDGSHRLAIASLALAIPLLGIAGGTAGVGGIVVVCLAIAFVNLVWGVRR
jgi:hypothetical protein